MSYLALQNLLKQHPKQGQGKHTHSVYGGSNMSGSYTVPQEKIGELHQLLNKVIFEEGSPISIVEKIQPVTPLIIDFDFKYKEKQTSRQYNENVLKNIVSLFMGIVQELYQLSDNQKICFVMEKDDCMDANKKQYQTKDGIHFLFPHIIAEKSTYRVFREELLKFDMKPYFENEGFTFPSNTPDEIIDESIYKGGNWFIYGSGKPTEQDMRYKLTHIYKDTNDTLTSVPHEMYLDNPLEIIKLNSVSNKQTINVDYTDSLKSSLKSKPLKPSKSVESVESMEIDPQVIHKKKKDEINLASRLIVECLSTDRASDYSAWRDVGLCANNISSCDKMRNAWIQFSKKWSMYHDDTECKKKWEEFTSQTCDDPLTIGSLKYWAKYDDFDRYKVIIQDSLGDLMKVTTKGNKDQPTGLHADVANVIYHYFRDEFVCSSIKENAWYYFNKGCGGKWEKTDLGHILRSKLSSEVVDLFEKYAAEYKSQIQEEGDNFDRRNTNCYKIILKLKDSSYKDKIMKECREYFYDKTFGEKLNSKLTLIGFENGVYDLTKSIFREGLPDDYMSMSCGLTLPISPKMMPMGFEELKDEISFMSDYDESLSGLDDFLKKVFPIPAVLEYTLRFLASCLSGEIREEKFYFWTGSGGNGKSKLIELIDFTFGDYSRSMDVSYLTTKRGSSSSASPELESVKHARFVSMSEPEKTDQIYVGKLKQMTGGDKMTSRQLFGETTQFKPQFKMVLMCNDLPKLAGNDGGIWRRIEVVKYLAKFTDKPKPSPAEPYQYLADTQLSEKLEQWKILFMIRLLEKYIQYDKPLEEGGGTLPPEEVKEMTKSYRTANDVIANWMNDDIVESDKTMKFEDLFDAWERWCDDEGYPSKNRPDKKEIKEALLKRQEKTDYGLVVGKVLKDGAPNGTRRNPRFNLRSVEE